MLYPSISISFQKKDASDFRFVFNTSKTKLILFMVFVYTIPYTVIGISNSPDMNGFMGKPLNAFNKDVMRI